MQYGLNAIWVKHRVPDYGGRKRVLTLIMKIFYYCSMQSQSSLAFDDSAIVQLNSMNDFSESRTDVCDV